MLFSKVHNEVTWSNNHKELVVFAEDCTLFTHNQKDDAWSRQQKARLYVLKDVLSKQKRLLCVGNEDDTIVANFLIQPTSGSNIKQLDRATATMVWVPKTEYETIKTRSKRGQKKTLRRPWTFLQGGGLQGSNGWRQKRKKPRRANYSKLP